MSLDTAFALAATYAANLEEAYLIVRYAIA
jgi:hypothetical protein